MLTATPPGHNLSGNPEGSPQWPKLVEYLELMAHGMGEEEAWQRAFGDRRQLEKDLSRYVDQDRYSYLAVDIPVDLDRGSMEVRALTPAEVAAVQGEFLAYGSSPEAARPFLESALAMNPDLALAQEAMGVLCGFEKDRERAREHLTRAIALDRSRHLSHYYLAVMERVAAEPGWTDRAEGHLLAALTNDPGLAPAHADLAAIYAAKDESLERAIVVARRAVRWAPESVDYRLNLARLLSKKGEGHDEALQSVQFALRLSLLTPAPVVANSVCWYGSLSGFAAQVMSACETAVKLRPESGSFRDSRAVARALTGDLKGAVEDFRFFLNSEDSQGPALIEERERWLAELEQGRSPLDEATLAALP